MMQNNKSKRILEAMKHKNVLWQWNSTFDLNFDILKYVV